MGTLAAAQVDGRSLVIELKERGYTPETIAAEIGVSARQVYRWANGEHQPLRIYRKALVRLLQRAA